jgi:hypothetical protein
MRPPSAAVHVADGADGMRPVVAPVLADGSDAIERVIPSQWAADWMAHWHATAESRGWSGGGLIEQEADQNAGILSVYLASGPEASAIRCDWQRARGGDLMVQITPADVRPPPFSLVQEFVDQIDTRLRDGTRESGFFRGWLTYDGLPWTGELWLSDSLRLAQPSRFAPGLLGRQAVLVDALVKGIGQQGLRDAFAQTRRELCLVLSPILGVALRDGLVPRNDWVPVVDDQNRIIDCRVELVGYTELDSVAAMPARGAAPALPLVAVNRPNLEPMGVWPEDHSIKVPVDIHGLWQQFQSLAPPLREQFLRACNAYAIARSMFPNQRTAYATFLVVALEALKPAGRRAHDANVYDVVATLLDTATADRLQKLRHPPQKVRSGQVHRGELRSGELGGFLEADAFADPSFSEMLTALSCISRQCLIAWLQRGGIQKLVWMPRPAPARAKGARPAPGGRRGQKRR